MPAQSVHAQKRLHAAKVQGQLQNDPGEGLGQGPEHARWVALEDVLRVLVNVCLGADDEVIVLLQHESDTRRHP